ncbi:hypothetical protein JCM6882_009438 [Rhodosporidiobolus microsporus]
MDSIQADALQVFERVREFVSDSHPITLALIAAAVYTVVRLTYNLALSPIKHVPGPMAAASTEYWALSHNMRGNKYLRVHELFQKYGPVVRTGPNTVTLRNYRYLQLVYMSKWDKITAYDGFRTNHGVPNSFSAIEQSEAQGKRRGMLPQYATACLVTWQDVFDSHLLEVVKLLRNNPAQNSIDVLGLVAHGLIDVLGEIVLDTQIGAVADFAKNTPNPMARAITMWPKRGTIKGQLHPLVWKAAEKIPVEGWQHLVQSDANLANFVAPIVSKARARLAAGDVPSRPSLVHRLSTVTNSMTGEKWPEADVTSECIDHFLAGTETTSTSSAYIMYTLSNRPDVMAKLQEELDGIMGLDEVPDIQLLARQPYLNAVLKESLRLFTPALGSLDRIVPAGGIVVDGVFLPAGTAIGLQSYTTHRDPEVWSDPFEFIPERWLKETPEMKAAYIPFSIGGRNCPGQNLAWFDLRLFISVICRNFDVKPAKHTTPASMEPYDLTTVSPTGGRCDLHFIPRSA